jgi:proteasome alpha subunit
MYSPDGRIYQVEYALETVKRGTLAIGVKCNDGVVIAVEENPRPLQVSNLTQKIFQVDKHIGIAAAGYIPDARVQVDNARLFSQSNKLTYDEPVEVETVAKHLADQSHQFTQYSGVRPYGVALIIAGVDNKGGSIYVTDPSGTYVSYAAVAIGENSEAVTEFLEKNYKSDMTLEDGASLATAAINLKDEKKDGSKHVKMSWIKLDKQIMEKVSESNVEKFVQSAKQKFSK